MFAGMMSREDGGNEMFFFELVFVIVGLGGTRSQKKKSYPIKQTNKKRRRGWRRGRSK